MESVKTHGVDPQALRANKLTLVERLADDLAHEIKNPLHSMVINLEVLKRRVSRWSGADATELMRYVGILSGELDRVSRRVDLLLRMVRMDRGGEPVTLSETVEDLLELVELERERHRISIEMHAPDHPARTRLPRDTARQIVLNLLLIALDSAAPGGVITISSSLTADGEALSIVTVPGEGDRTSSGGVSDGRLMQATVGALVESLGGRLEVYPPTASENGARIVVTVPPETS